MRVLIWGFSIFALSKTPEQHGEFSATLRFYLVYFQLCYARAAQTIGLALIIGGGFGNAIDRFALGYVIDFIETTFIKFPIFNVADMGVTCGIVIFLCGFFVQSSHPHTHEEASRIHDAQECSV